MEGLTKGAWLVACALVSAGARAGEQPPSGTGSNNDIHWYAQIDNDVAFHTDRWYTSGVRIARAHEFDEGRYAEFGILQEVYTPDPHRVAPGTIDRPYAARLLFTAARHDFMPGLYRTLELDAGVRGPGAQGEESTSFVHRLIPAPDFDWSRQLPNEVDVQAIAVQTHDFKVADANRARWAVHYGAVLGNQMTFLHAGAEIRTGGAHAIAAQPLRFAATPPIALGGEKGWNAFAGASARWVLRNEFLSVNANAIGPPIERKDGVYRIAGGIEGSASWGALTFMLVQDSREFETQHSPHRFGVLGLRLDFL
jgi:hypothetical protein